MTEDLFRLPRGDLRRLAAVHVAISPEAGEMLVSAERILRELPSSIVRARVEARGAVRPPVMWRDTYARRVQTRDYSLFVSAPTERRYDTPLARLLKLSLSQVVFSSELADLHTSRGVGNLVDGRRAAALRLLRHAKLREVRSVRALPIHALRGARRHRHTEPIVAYVDRFRDAVEEQSPSSVREVVTRRLLLPWQPDRLFELYAGFQLIAALKGAGFTEVGRRLLPQRELPFARLASSSGERVTVWYQRGLPLISGPAAFDGEYGRALFAAGLRLSSLRPDFIVTREPSGEILLVEVKFTAREDETPDRVGIKDVLTYLHDGRQVIAFKQSPRALVIAWNSNAVPNGQADVVVCSQYTIKPAVDTILDSWNARASA